MIKTVDISGSTAIILHENYALCENLRQWLAPSGWVCDCHDAADDFTFAADACPAIVMMDAVIAPEKRTAWLTALRALPGPVAGTPVLLLAPVDAPGQNGTAGRIDLPLDRTQALGMIEHWAGPLEEHGFRDPSAPHYRLVRLAGRSSADRLLRSFADHVEAALARYERQEEMTRAAHEIAGLAGTLGFGELSGLWSAVERGESNGPTETQAATRAVLTELKRLISKEE